jgi:predicted house-cleaning noncanonical NTP pyrophosphatase (MazG superfamily)
MTKKKAESDLKKRGRKSQFDPNKHPAIVKDLAEKGKTNEQIADILNISTVTLNTWMQKNPEFLSAMREGKQHADGEVIDSLFAKAKGTVKVKEIKVIQNPDGTTRKEITEKEIPPDVIAQKFWLMNRQPKDWRDKQIQEITGKDGAPIQIRALSDEELTKIILDKKA